MGGSCSAFSGATEAIRSTLTNIAGLGTGTVSTTGECTTTTVTTTDGGGWPWWAWFLLLLGFCCVLFACCGLCALPFLVKGNRKGTKYEPEEGRPLMMQQQVTTVPMATPTVPMGRPTTMVPTATATRTGAS